jgi:hypothetical protein
MNRLIIAAVILYNKLSVSAAKNACLEVGFIE